MTAKNLAKVEFGDFQTPPALCRQVVQLLSHQTAVPKTIIEPTCGTGGFLVAAAREWSDARLIGFDRSCEYVAMARRRLGDEVMLVGADFFSVDWDAELGDQPDPLLILGNPPWITNAGVGVLNGGNLPKKSNFQNLKGFDAKTGKANFDISEWMVIRLIEAVNGRRATLAMLLKTSVVRKVLRHAWANGLQLDGAAIYPIDASRHFDAAVSACLFVATITDQEAKRECAVYESLEQITLRTTIGWRDNALVADARAYERSGHVRGRCPFTWRSGVKHDCSKVMEFRICSEGLLNGFGESIHIEDELIYPLLKTSEVAKANVPTPTRAVLLTQRNVGDETTSIAMTAPRTWAYLRSHAEFLDRRASSIYRNRPRFSVFGIGDYTFQPWKVAISGFYKRTKFSLVPPHEGRPVMVDDATYFLGFEGEREARLVVELLNSIPVQDLLNSFIFMDAKRPVTIDVLRRLDLAKVAQELGKGKEYATLFGGSPTETPSLFDAIS